MKGDFGTPPGFCTLGSGMLPAAFMSGCIVVSGSKPAIAGCWFIFCMAGPALLIILTLCCGPILLMSGCMLAGIPCCCWLTAAPLCPILIICPFAAYQSWRVSATSG